MMLAFFVLPTAFAAAPARSAKPRRLERAPAAPREPRFDPTASPTSRITSSIGPVM